MVRSAAMAVLHPCRFVRFRGGAVFCRRGKIERRSPPSLDESLRSASLPQRQVDSGKKQKMKIFRALCVVLVAASLVLSAFDGQASAGGMYGWGSAGCCGRDGYGYSGYGYGG